MSTDTINASVIQRQDLPRGHLILRVAPTSFELSDFQPGQYTQLGLAPEGNEMIKRTYSIASPPGLDHLEFYIKVVDDGEFTTLLDKAGEGAPVWLSDSIHGGFTLESVPTGKDIILVATGTGLAPYISMIRHGAGTGRWRRLVVVHGCCYADELGFRDLIEGIAADDPSVTYIPTVTREPEDSGWAGLRGRVQAIFETEAYERLVRAPLDPEQCHLFLCGNPQMIDDVEVVLGRLGFEHHTAEAPGNLHFERWW